MLYPARDATITVNTDMGYNQEYQAAVTIPAAIDPDEAKPSAVIDTDRAGNSIVLPTKIDTIISMGPSNSEIISALGFAGKIIAIDDYSDNVQGINPDLPKLSMMSPDGEMIIDLDPDVLIVTGMTIVGGVDPFLLVKQMGVCVIYLPSSTSIDEIKDDIMYLAEVLGAVPRGREIVAEMEREVEAIRAIAADITKKKTVYFEIAAAPFMYSFGSGVFLHEMIELIGATNILAAQNSWMSVGDEIIVDANPDVILTSVNYIDEPIADILSRPGWDAITAVRDEAVYYIDTDASSRPSHHVVKALRAMAEAVYPDLYR